MSTEAIVSELMGLIQSQIADSSGESLSVKEERALAIGRRAAELALSEMIAVEPAEPLCVNCECGGIALSKLDPIWEELFPAEQRRVVQLLVESVTVHHDGLDVRTA